MNIFISWSGLESGKMAEALRRWLPLIIDSPDFWMSSLDIPEGKRWSGELSQQLDSCEFGILIVTPQNMTAPWLLFEAGALSKNVKNGRVVPYLVTVEKNALPSPLSQFQALAANRDETFRLVSAINRAMPKSSNDDVVKTRFNALWPQMQDTINNIMDDVKNLIPSEIKSNSESDYRNGELEKLYKELSETKEIIKELVKNINLSTIVFNNNEKKEENLEPSEFVGAWINGDIESHLYIKIKNGKLVAPYCYMGNSELTAEYYGWRKIGEYWFARFRWFDSGITGFSFYKLKSEDIIEGNWWYDDNMPADVTAIENFNGNNIDGGNPIIWKRIKNIKIPQWAENFISKFD